MDVGYELLILWREGDTHLEHNKKLAESRHRSLENRFMREEPFKENYRRAILKNLDEGYAVRLSKNELDSG